MCIVIWVKRDQFEEERTRIWGKPRDIWHRLTSTFSSKSDHSPPQYTAMPTAPNRYARPAIMRPSSLTLPIYAGYRKKVDTHLINSNEAETVTGNWRGLSTL